MPKREEVTASGLHVVTEDEKAPKKEKREQPITMCRGRSELASGIEKITEVNLAGPRHRLDPDERKGRREDNRWIKARHRKFRRRKKHGRP